MLPLGAYLLKPVQRVLKYSLLLEVRACMCAVCVCVGVCSVLVCVCSVCFISYLFVCLQYVLTYSYTYTQEYIMGRESVELCYML